MNHSSDHCSEIVVAGFGSPHGDDQAGWRVVEMLERWSVLPARPVSITESTQLLDAMEGCRRLILVDGCRAGRPIGTITRLEWPDPRVRQFHNHSTHGVGLCNALQLAERLGRLPASVEIFGIEIGGHQPFEEMSPSVVQAVAELADTIFSELCETIHARAVVG